MAKSDFVLLKRTYPISQFDRYCDGFDYILDNSTWLERRKWGVKKNKLQRVIKEGEKYMYIVGKEHGEFRYVCVCFPDYEIIRKHFCGFKDD